MADAIKESVEFLLAPQLQAWMLEQGWSGLNEVQAQAIPIILRGDRDVIITADTAGGKTEAAYFPILTRLAADQARGGGVQVIYISPLKALINDQHGRVEELGRCVDVPVCRWHGDAPVGPKRKLLNSPEGVLLITPESVEALFVRRGPEMPKLLSGLVYIVIDELHCFIGAERGRQLQSLLHRMELACGRWVPRIALSATIGGLPAAAEFLRPGGGGAVVTIAPPAPPRKVHLVLRGYEVSPPKLDPHSTPPGSGDNHEQETSRGRSGMMEELHAALKDSNNLIYANSRAKVELVAERLQRISQDLGTDGVFLPHHGSLSAEHRRDVEKRLKEAQEPTNAVATSTLELGINLGSIDSIALVECPSSVSSMRQRLGRSGRANGKRPSMRILITERPVDESTLTADFIRPSLVQAVAMTELMLQKWCEPPDPEGSHYSTLVQQLISLTAERRTVTEAEARHVLCEKGPFRQVGGNAFGQIVSALAKNSILAFGANGALQLAERGLKIIRNYKFYAAFSTPAEYRLEFDGNELGTVPISRAIAVDEGILFRGLLWRIVGIDRKRRRVDLAKATDGAPPVFFGDGFHVHDRVRREMLTVYRSERVPAYLDESARRLLSQGRDHFKLLGLDRRAVLPTTLGTALFPWAGDRIMNTLAAILLRVGALALRTGFFISVDELKPEDVVDLLEQLSRSPEQFGDLGKVEVMLCKDRQDEKWDHLVPLELRAADYARRFFDPEGAREAVKQILAMERS